MSSPGEISRGSVSSTRVATGGSLGSNGTAPHASTPVQLAQLTYAVSEEHLCTMCVGLMCIKRPIQDLHHNAHITKTLEVAAVVGAALLSAARVVVYVVLWRRDGLWIWCMSDSWLSCHML